jgi:hypothetical protein
MSEDAVEAGARALLTFLEAAFASRDVTRLAGPPAAHLPADGAYFRIEDEDGLCGTVGATPGFLGAQSTTALVEQLHRDDVPGVVARAGAGGCVMLIAGERPSVVALR